MISWNLGFYFAFQIKKIICLWTNLYYTDKFSLVSIILISVNSNYAFLNNIEEYIYKIKGTRK